MDKYILQINIYNFRQHLKDGSIAWKPEYSDFLHHFRNKCRIETVSYSLRAGDLEKKNKIKFFISFPNLNWVERLFKHFDFILNSHFQNTDISYTISIGKIEEYQSIKSENYIENN